MDDVTYGDRVLVTRGKLEGRQGSVLDTRPDDRLALVSEDGPDDQDDWVPFDDLDQLGEWVGPKGEPCYLNLDDQDRLGFVEPPR